jgi:hypothetical protein
MNGGGVGRIRIALCLAFATLPSTLALASCLNVAGLGEPPQGEDATSGFDASSESNREAGLDRDAERDRDMAACTDGMRLNPDAVVVKCGNSDMSPGSSTPQLKCIEDKGAYALGELNTLTVCVCEFIVTADTCVSDPCIECCTTHDYASCFECVGGPEGCQNLAAMVPCKGVAGCVMSCQDIGTIRDNCDQ